VTTSIHTAIESLLRPHVPEGASETASRARTLAFLAATPAPCSRETLEGHVTASAMVLDPAGRALLLFHARLELWVQPGGHIEPGEDGATAALREAREESGLPDLELDAASLLDIDVHPIPKHPKKPEPAHWHYDLCFLARTRKPKLLRIDPTESHAARWVSVEELPTLPIDTATRRRLTKAFSRGSK
jgi:ADP-ribose pyrophosphatase YjhB (NUDIX family)